MPEIEEDASPIGRTETLGGFVIRARALYLPDLRCWEPRVTIEHVEGQLQPFTVPCGPECYRKDHDDALQVGWATARQWLDGGRIPWKPRSAP